jgi:hypothetical protein
MCFTYSTLGNQEIGSVHSSMTNDLTTRCSESILVGEDDSDWLHSNLSSIPHARSLEEMQNGSTSAGGMRKRASLKDLHILRRNDSVILLRRNDKVKGNGTQQ